MRSWWTERQTLAALGVKDIDRFDELLEQAAAAGRPKVAVSREERSRQIAAFVAAAG
jgi:hypothetical protein